MKVFLAILILSGTASVAAAQNKPLPSPSGTPIKVMTAAEADALNGTSDPVINGIPYSEYKAQQEALQAKPAAQTSQQGLKLISSAPVADPAVGRKNEPAPVVPVLQQAAPAEKTEAAPAVKPVLGTGVFRGS
jgi:hypothetical protein